MTRITSKTYKKLKPLSEKQIQIDFTEMLKPYQFKQILAYHINNGGIGNSNFKFANAKKGEVSGIFDYHITSTLERGHLYVEFKSPAAFKLTKNDIFKNECKCLSPNQALIKQCLDRFNIPNGVFCDAYSAFSFVKKTLNF